MVLRKAFEDLLPEEIVWRQKEQFSTAWGYGWIDTLKADHLRAVSDREMEHAAERFPVNPPQNKEEYYYRSIFEEHFRRRPQRRACPPVPSVACSTAEALAWDQSLRQLQRPLGACRAHGVTTTTSRTKSDPPPQKIKNIFF